MDDEASEAPKFTVVDYVVFSLMLVVSVGIGVYSSLRGKGASSTQAFLLGGRDMSLAPVAFSLTGGVISAISILGLPTELYLYGTQLVMNILGAVVGVLVVRNLILPIVYPLRLVSIYQYIEIRFKSRVLRKFATACQLLSSCFYVGLCLYAPSLALSSVTNLPTWASVIIMGSICTFYITIGGVKAVVYTDVIQTLVMFFGVLAVVIVVCRNLGGIEEVWEVAGQGGRLEFFNLDPSPFTRHTLWSTMVMGVFMVFSFLGVSQPQYQRFASVPTLAQAQLLSLLFLLGMSLLWGVFYTSGLVAYALYKDCDPLTSGKIEKPDQIIPYMVTDKLHHLTGMPGLFVAAVYGGVLSSLSSQGNAIACVVWEDFLKERPYFRGISDRSATNVVKLLSSMTGLVAIGVGLLAGKLGTINYVISLVSAAIRGPLCGLFFVGMCAPWVNTKGAMAGLAFSLIVNIWMVIGRFVVSGKQPVRLPLSLDGCLDQVAGTPTALNATLGLLANATAVAFTAVAASKPEYSNLTEHSLEDENMIYDISYCYNGAIGIIINFVVSSLVACCTGPNLPGAVEARLVFAPSARLHRALFLLVGGSGRPRDAREKGPEDKEAALDMLSMSS
ncbi:sodium-coupled monocarboxylate transporter 1-like [Penaeus chinensis]|uniref:sodium-coupled monocarboxylate transporter 1-like n=1 Tax=Penaeus chinensis TaxID=139456 RepID=UPI001FB82E74|nr:sodium-coupled monocarboxylate transporter 1-like [Penaeus chinensis]